MGLQYVFAKKLAKIATHHVFQRMSQILPVGYDNLRYKITYILHFTTYHTEMGYKCIAFHRTFTSTSPQALVTTSPVSDLKLRMNALYLAVTINKRSWGSI